MELFAMRRSYRAQGIRCWIKMQYKHSANGNLHETAPITFAFQLRIACTAPTSIPIAPNQWLQLTAGELENILGATPGKGEAGAAVAVVVNNGAAVAKFF